MQRAEFRNALIIKGGINGVFKVYYRFKKRISIEDLIKTDN